MDCKEGKNAMNGEWSLKELYAGYDDPKYKEDLRKADELCLELADFASDFGGEPAEVIKKAYSSWRKSKRFSRIWCCLRI
jgi:hypothetical protein